MRSEHWHPSSEPICCRILATVLPPRLALAALPWLHKTDPEEPGCLLGRTVPRLSSSEVTQRYLHAIAGYSSGTCSQPGETLEPRSEEHTSELQSRQ